MVFVSLVLIPLTEITHCINVDQRYVGLEFNVINSTILTNKI